MTLANFVFLCNSQFPIGKMGVIISSVWMSHCEYSHENDVSQTRAHTGTHFTCASQMLSSVVFAGHFSCSWKLVQLLELGFYFVWQNKSGTDYM